MLPNEVLNFDETMKFLRISRPTLIDLCKKNKIPCQKVGRQWRFLKSEVCQFLKGKYGTFENISPKGGKKCP